MLGAWAGGNDSWRHYLVARFLAQFLHASPMPAHCQPSVQACSLHLLLDRQLLTGHLALSQHARLEAAAALRHQAGQHLQRREAPGREQAPRPAAF